VRDDGTWAKWWCGGGELWVSWRYLGPGDRLDMGHWRLGPGFLACG
jgi:hypothetical protein